MNWSAIATVLSMSVVVERVLEAVCEPIINLAGAIKPEFKRILYLLMGTGVGYALGLNAFPAFVKFPAVGDIMTALLLGSGSQVVHAVIGSLQARGNQVVVVPTLDSKAELEMPCSEPGSLGKLG
jgi:hypothetical protein